MSAPADDLPLGRVTVRQNVRDPDEWYWQVPVVAQLRSEGMTLAPATVLVGENGSGKSTLVEAIARAWRELLTAQVHHWGPRPSAEDTALWRALWLETAYPRPQGGIWLRAESMHELEKAIKAALKSDVATVIDIPIDPDEDVYPFVAPGTGLKDMIIGA